MKLYTFNKEKLYFEEMSILSLVLKVAITFIVLFIIISFQISPRPSLENLSNEEKLIVIREYNDFSEEKLKELIYSLNFKFPDIVFAQAKLESSNFNSTIFKENNNLFGMKEASIRATLAKGTNRGHAYYDNWQNSVIDYALYYSTYLYKIKTKEEYYEYLRQNYAEDSNYVNKLKSYKLN